jgi:hypothetical protein
LTTAETDHTQQMNTVNTLQNVGSSFWNTLTKSWKPFIGFFVKQLIAPSLYSTIESASPLKGITVPFDTTLNFAIWESASAM